MKFVVENSLFGKMVTGAIFVIGGVLLFQMLVEPDETAYKPKPDQVCEGQPIAVDYPYYGGMLGPHACKPQCDDGKQRFVLYSNGKATQCGKTPGCLDWGEDQGVTCIPPAA